MRAGLASGPGWHSGAALPHPRSATWHSCPSDTRAPHQQNSFFLPLLPAPPSVRHHAVGGGRHLHRCQPEEVRLLPESPNGFLCPWPGHANPQAGRTASWDRSGTAVTSSSGICSQGSVLISDLGEVRREEEQGGVEIQARVAGATGPWQCGFCSEDRRSL